MKTVDLLRIAARVSVESLPVQVGMNPIKRGTSLEQFWKLLPPGTEEALKDIDVSDASKATVELPGVGWVEAWVDECSEGEDRGGYVKWYELLDVKDSDGSTIVLEADTDGSEIYFGGRNLEL